jgi:hypothetical protein
MKHFMRRFGLAAAVLGLVAGVGGQARADLVLISPTDDRGYQSNGTAFPDNDVFLRVFGDSTYYRAALEFSLSGVTAGATINSATLFLSDRGTSTNATIQVHGYSGDGVVTFSDMSANNQIASFNTAAGTSADYNLDVTSYVQSLVNGSGAYGGFLLKSSVEGSFNGADIASSEYSIADYRPTLTIDFTSVAPTPEPSTLISAGIGVAMMLGYARCRRKAKPVA